MIMPYGVKPTQLGEGSAGPSAVNFDRLWEAAFRPAIESLHYDAVRADQDLGALIINEMIERLAVSDLVIADMTIPNGNVYYEIGVRHAAKQRGCILISADWANPLFDLAQMRQLRYPLPATTVDDAGAAAIAQVLRESIPGLARGESPFYAVLPGFPQLDAQRASSFRNELEQLSAFQSAVAAARATPVPDCGERALALAAHYRGKPMRSIVALDLLYLLRDCTDWDTTLKFIDDLPGEIRDMPIVKEQRALAQSKAGDHYTAIGGLTELIKLGGETSERRGLLGGRYKKLYSSIKDPKSDKEIAEKAGFLNQAIFQYDRGMHADLNDYYPASNLARLYRARGRPGDEDRAQVAAAVTLTACERALARGSQDEWLKPTLLGAAFDHGDADRARELVDEIQNEGLSAWKLATTIPDCELAMSLHPADTAAALAPVLASLKSLAAGGDS
jgi:hypothetical protein